MTDKKELNVEEMENVAGGGAAEGNFGDIVEKVIKTTNPDFDKDKTTKNTESKGNVIMDILKDESDKKENEIPNINQGGCCDPVNHKASKRFFAR